MTLIDNAAIEKYVTNPKLRNLLLVKSERFFEFSTLA